MKVLLVSNMYPSEDYPFYGVFVRNFERRLKANDFSFDKVVIKGKGRSVFDKINKYLTFTLQIRRVLSSSVKYDFIYVHYISHSLLPFLLFYKQESIPIVLNAHGSDVFPVGVMGRVIRRLVTPVIKRAILIVVPSDYYKGVVCNVFGTDENRVFISPSGGIDLKLFNAFSDEKKGDSYTVGFVSRIDEGKGWDVLLKAIKILVNRGAKLSVLLIGKGIQSESLKLMIKELKLSTVITHVEGVKHEDLPKYYAKMKVFVFPSMREAESLGLVGIEAMACKVPVIGSNIGGIKGYVKPGYNGELFTPGDYVQLAEKIEAFITMDNEDYLKCKKNARETAQEYDADKVARELRSKLCNIVDC